LLRPLEAYKPSAAQSATVRVIGFPNVGKSSLINTLKRDKVLVKVCAGTHEEGYSQFNLERGLWIVDSPRVIFEDYDNVRCQKET
jgi:nuclear GTP-binding protein